MTYAEKFEQEVDNAKRSIDEALESEYTDLFKTNMKIMEAMASLEEAHNILVEVSSVAFSRVIK